jgi:hypothetical protein
MASTPEQQTLIQLAVRATNPALLQGLDSWLQLGLISEATVLWICQAHLSCPLPEVVAMPVQMPQEQPAPSDFIPIQETATPNRSSGLIVHLLQSLMAEISVVWLLFLGVFLVVVSSGVLAASHWQNFSTVGQYGVLLGYTLAFWVATILTGRQSALRLTHDMVQIATLLIIPVNFWMMDGLRLWSSAAGWGMAAIAALVLSTITGWLLRTAESRISPAMLTTAIGLSWLHWGWGWTGFPLVATYLGTIGTAVALLDQDRRRSDLEAVSGDGTQTPFSLPAVSAIAPSTIAIACSALLLIARASLVAHVPITRLGLAVGICGWLLSWLSRKDDRRIVWGRGGAGLLLVGWLVSVTVTPPWQAIAVSGLALWLLVDQLRRLGERQSLILAFLIGLQTVWLLWLTVPFPWQQSAIATCIKLAGSQSMPPALVGIGGFPYLILILRLAFRFRRWQRLELANTAEFLVLGLGVILTMVSYGNPLIRSLNLSLSAITLAVVVWQRHRLVVPLIYLTHGTALAAIAAIIHAQFPLLDSKTWLTLCLIGMAMEWIGCSGLTAASTLRSSWQKSAWIYGLLLAAISVYRAFSLESPQETGILLVIPLLLTLLGHRIQFPHHRLATALSVLTVLIIQPLMLNSAPERLIDLGTTTVLMLFNTYQLQKSIVAALTVGFGLGFAAVTAWEITNEVEITLAIALLFVAIANLVLWSVRHWFSRRQSTLARLYTQATDGWAISLAGTSLFILSLVTLSTYLDWTLQPWNYSLAVGIVLIASIYRTWQQPSNAGFYAIAWSLELFVTGSVSLNGRSLPMLAIANLALGLGTQLLGDWWVSQAGNRRTASSSSASPSSRPGYRSSWHVIPLVFALLGLLNQHQEFTASTGLYTLAAACVGIGVGRRQQVLKPITYLCLAGLSIAAYELLIYQLMQAKGGHSGDGVVLLAAVAAGLAIAEWLLIPWLIPYLRLSSLEIKTTAHIHWSIGSALLPLAIQVSLSPTGEWLWIAIATLLSGYALANGNRQNAMDASAAVSWTYFGILESCFTLAYLGHQLLPDRMLFHWAGAIAAGLAYPIYLAPWHEWGWERRPWRQSMTILPGLVVLLTAQTVAIPSLLIVAAFYAWLADSARQMRLSYISILLADWAILRWLNYYHAQEPLWYAMLIGGSLLYVAQVDPTLRSPDARNTRHLLRSLAVGFISLSALYQEEIGIAGISPLLLGFLTIGLELVLILAGLVLRIRAFLYVGTATFMIQVIRQLWRFVADYSLLLWAMGIVVGLAFIWIAATFESRRVQVNALIRYWVTELEEWD